RHLDSPTAAAAATVGYLASVPMQFSLHFGFHPITLAVPLLLGALSCATEERWRWMAACLAGAAVTQEDALLFIAFFGVALALAGSPRRGLAVAAGAAVALAVVLQVVLPWLSGGGNVYTELAGGTPGAIALRLLSDPLE